VGPFQRLQLRHRARCRLGSRNRIRLDWPGRDGDFLRFPDRRIVANFRRLFSQERRYCELLKRHGRAAAEGRPDGVDHGLTSSHDTRLLVMDVTSSSAGKLGDRAPVGLAGRDGPTARHEPGSSSCHSGAFSAIRRTRRIIIGEGIFYDTSDLSMARETRR